MNLSFQMMRKAIRLFNNPDNPRSVNRKMQRQWLAQMEFLGNRHILAKPVERQTPRNVLF